MAAWRDQTHDEPWKFAPRFVHQERRSLSICARRPTAGRMTAEADLVRRREYGGFRIHLAQAPPDWQPVPNTPVLSFHVEKTKFEDRYWDRTTFLRDDEERSWVNDSEALLQTPPPGKKLYARGRSMAVRLFLTSGAQRVVVGADGAREEGLFFLITRSNDEREGVRTVLTLLATLTSRTPITAARIRCCRSQCGAILLSKTTMNRSAADSRTGI